MSTLREKIYAACFYISSGGLRRAADEQRWQCVGASEYPPPPPLEVDHSIMSGKRPPGCTCGSGSGGSR